jgi:hypothetical protein
MRRTVGAEEVEAGRRLVPVVAEHPDAERRAAYCRERDVDHRVGDRIEAPAARSGKRWRECARLLIEEGSGG